jgi:hypothetical protein
MTEYSFVELPFAVKLGNHVTIVSNGNVDIKSIKNLPKR